MKFARHFWQSWWFIGIGGLALLTIVASIVRLIERQKARDRLKRLEQERALERERTRIAQDLHDEMGAKLCRISFLSEIVKGEKSVNGEGQAVDSLSKTARDLLQSLRDRVAVQGAERGDFQNQQVEGALRETRCRHVDSFYHLVSRLCRGWF